MGENSDPAASAEMVERFGVITLNRSQRLNCLSRELVEAVLAGMDGLLAQGARALILRATPGAKVWSAGHDIGEISLDGADPVAWNVPFEVLLRRVRDCPAPVIGLIEGSVWGGACDLAVSLDMLVGAPSASFAITPAKLGLPYNAAGLSHFLGVLPLHIAKEMLYTAQPLSAQDAHRLGLLNRLVEPARLEESAFDLARLVASRAPLAVRVLKAEMRNLTRGPALTPDDFEDLAALRQEAFRGEDFKEGVTAFFEKRPPRFQGR